MGNKYIIITGGELFNKGAQSMTFITVDEIKKRFPNHQIMLLSDEDFLRTQDEKEQYNFIISQGILIYYFANGLYARYKRFNKAKINEASSILRNTDIMIDISGYALNSNWGTISSLSYASRIKTAKKFGIKVYLMPQSFGPFNYKGIMKPITNYLIKKYLKYPNVIFTREKEGYDLLTQKYGLKNIRLSQDLVLLNKEINLNNVFKLLPVLRSLEIKDNSIAIIPNMRNFQHGNKEEVIALYEAAINKLLKDNKTIYLIRHSFEDIEACEAIKSKYFDIENVVLLSEEFSCLEYDQLVKKFNFLIASRYHSIVHAYKNGIPCIALGWATKYHELLKMFNQEKYIFDVRQNINFDSFLKAIDEMNRNIQIESQTIKTILGEIQNTNVFDVLDERL